MTILRFFTQKKSKNKKQKSCIFQYFLNFLKRKNDTISCQKSDFSTNVIKIAYHIYEICKIKNKIHIFILYLHKNMNIK